ncbi:MAG: N-acetyl sugar amidotransferase [Pseudomonadota bacterium]
MKWCASCVLPDTRPNLRIESDGRCNACHAHESKKSIDWPARERALQDVVKRARSRSQGYDCLIPVSGGKDSTWQTVKCLEYGLKALAVTWRTPGRTEIGRRNLENLVALGVDHIDYRINPKVEARFMLKTFKRLGSTGIPMHLALFNIPLTLAARLQIPLVVWGENSAFEYGSAKDAHTGFRLDADWLKTYGVTHGTTAEDWVGEDLSRSDLTAYFGPAPEELRAAGIDAVFLGYYLPWDPDATHALAKAHGFKRNEGVARTGYYDYADIDDDFISLHHWMKWFKFGFTRTFDNLSLEIRNRRLSRSQAIAYLRERGDETPHGDIGKFCEFAGVSRPEFSAIAEKFRNARIWERRSDGVWHMPGFLIPDWNWS